MKDRKDANWVKMKIRVESFVTAKVGDMEEKTKEGKIRSMRKDLVG